MWIISVKKYRLLGDHYESLSSLCNDFLAFCLSISLCSIHNNNIIQGTLTMTRKYHFDAQIPVSFDEQNNIVQSRFPSVNGHSSNGHSNELRDQH